MSLIQISKLEPCANLGSIVGIDFGTTNSLAAYVKNNEVEIVPIEDGIMLLSVVSYDGNNIVVGAKATENDDAIFSIKRLMGGDDSKFLEKFPSFKLLSRNERINFNIHGKKISNIEIASEIFKKIKYFSENHLNQSISTAVITVPAYFNNKAKESIKIAAKLAGINAIRLLAEPTAAALAYKIKEEGIYLVYDLGGGTFDVSIIDFRKGIFKVLAVGGDDMLGGDDCDYIIAQKMINDLHLKINSPQDIKQLKSLAKILKESFPNAIPLNFIYQNKNYTYELTQDEFNYAVSALINRTIDIAMEVVNLAHKKIQEIKKVLLVGGSTKMQIVKDRLTNIFGMHNVLYTSNPETVVVEGAALQAHALNFGSKTLLIDVIPLSLGIETMGGIMETIIERNTSIPISKSQVFTTHVDNQTSILINVFQGERELIKDNKELARLELKNIPPMPAGIPKVKVVFTVDENALLKVSAHETVSNTEQEVIINPNYELTEDEINIMISDSFINAEEDLMKRELYSAKIDLEKIVSLMEKFIQEDRELLSDDEYNAISSTIENATKDKDGLSDAKQIKNHKKEIEAISANFLEKRFNKYLRNINL